MNKLQQIGIATSCFIPLYVILGFKNMLKIIDLKNIGAETFNWKTFDFIFNLTIFGVWILFFLFGVTAIISFKKSFLEAYERSGEKIIIDNAENITGDYYFTYFSLFILTFFTIDPTCWIDVAILFMLMLFIISVYVSNEMWFINPVLNVIGYKAFKVIYSKPNVENRQFEIRVFSRESLNKKSGEECNISYSSHDFSVCYSKKHK